MDSPDPSRRAWGLPITIMAVGAIIAGVFALYPGAARPPAATASATPAMEGVPVAPGVITVEPDDPVIGAAAAPVTVFIFTQFDCPFCRHFFAATWPTFKEKLIDTGRVRLVFKLFPIGDDQQDPHAAEAAIQAALCAHAQGDFLPYFTQLSALAAGYTSADFERYAKEDGLDMTAFMACFRSGAYAEVMATTIRQALTAGITATPTFVVHDRLYEGALSEAELEQLIARL